MQPLLYTIIKKQTLHELLETFYQCIRLPIQILDENGEILEKFGEVHGYCSLFKQFLSKEESCTKLHANASKLAMSLGETYIFSCHSNLNHIVFPLSNNNLLLGSILVGPFLMDTPDSLLLADISKKYEIPTVKILEMYEEANTLPVLEPSKVTYVSRLLYYMCSGLVTDVNSQFVLNHQKLSQQSRINESIQMYKASSQVNQKAYPYEKEKALITKLKTGDTENAKALLNDLLGYVFFAEGSNLEVVKSRATELSSLLSRAAIEGGATSDSILKINNQFLMSVPTIDSLDDLCYKLQETIDVFTECMFNYIPSKNHEIIRKSIRYISKNFSRNLTLEEVAEQVHLNPAYFSTLFKQSTGSSFKEYLNMVRVEESKRLLSNTDYSIIDISLAAGFGDQSYFSKVFKKYTGMTPKQYR